jgi:putative transferase (TIGR04331 family)
MTKLHLVTTADERTWPSQRKILFLSRSCQRWRRRHQWQSLDAILAAPYGLGERSKDSDHAHVRDIEMSLFPELCDLLGRWHGVSSDQRYWKIIFGHWFRRYVELIFNRTRTLQACVTRYSIDSTTVLENSAYSLATSDSYAAIWASNDDRWNHELYVRLMKLMPEFDIRFENVMDDRGERSFVWSCKESMDLRTFVVLGLRYVADRAISMLQADDDLLIVNSYLPRKEELKLKILLGQCPRLFSSKLLAIKMEPDIELRRELSGQISCVKKGGVEQMVRTLLFDLLPICYLEAFSSIKKYCARTSWPNKPRAIFTSNNFDTDEVFKFWVADKVLQGSKYIIGQHGNNYGTHRHHLYPSIEEITADRFVTWGWRDGLPQHCPAFLLKTVGRKVSHSNDPAGELLLIQFGLPHRLNTWDVVAEFDDYFEDQKRFVNGLTASSYKQLRVRLSRAHELMGWGEQERWREFDSRLKLDDGTEDIDKLIAKSRLVVHSYDSTGILETLSKGIPTVAFWQNGLGHVRDSARPWYQLLIDAGIVHLSAASAAAHVSNVWDDVAGWWDLAVVKKARLAFCNQYARTIPHPLQELKNILKFD